MTRFEILASSAGLGIVTVRGIALTGPEELARMVFGAGVRSFHDHIVDVSARDRSGRARATTSGSGGGDSEPTAGGSAMPDS
jgi:hypothetical protein